ncbi:MAG: cyclic nucleotide-binding domain-containing protein [Nitrospinae bacterium]|nr:cyclic nucleotide-binding domain-containing protein [Nitrospinota bacterium]
MDIEQKVALLRTTDLMGFLETPLLKQFAAACKEIALNSNEVLFHEGSMENAMYFILSGEIVIYKGIKQVAILTAGQYFGEMSLLEAKPRSASARAGTGALLMEITETQFNQRLISDPRSLASIIKTLSSRIRRDLDLMAADFRKLSLFMHDIKNCLTPLGLSEMYVEELIELFEGTSPGHKPREGLEELRKTFEVMHRTGDTLLTLVNQSLDHAKRLSMEYVKEKTAIAPLIQETVEGLSCHNYLKGKRIETNVASDAQEGVFNSLDIKRVLQNLIINAGYATGDNGVIEVAVKNKGPHIQFSVIDKGSGIPEEIRPYLFKDPVTTKKDGNGLGLLSCKEIVEESHDGNFWYESKVGHGTTFHFAIPR